MVSTERGAIKKRTGSVLFAPGTSGTFPTLAATDTFKRAEEKPLSNGGKWTLLVETKETGEIGPGEHWQAGVPNSGAFWNVVEQTNPAVSVELQTRPTELAFNSSIWACVQSGATLSGYQLRLRPTAAEKYELALYRWKESTIIELAKVEGVTYQSGDFLCISVRGGAVTGWRKAAGGTVTKLIEAPDTTFTKGFGGISSRDKVLRLNNFAVGEMPAFTELEFQGMTPVKTAAGSFLIAASTTKLYSINKEGEGLEIGEGFKEEPWSIVQFEKGTAKTAGPVYLQNGTDKPQTWVGAEGKEKVKEWPAEEAAFEGKEMLKKVPKAKYMTVGLGVGAYMFLGNCETEEATKETSAVRWCEIKPTEGIEKPDPTLWPKENVLYFDPNDGQEITGLGRVGPYILVFKPTKVWAIHAASRLPLSSRKISDNIGCASHRSIVETPMGTFFLSTEQGVYLTNGSTLKEMSYTVRPTLLKINQEKRKLANAAFWNNHYYLSFPYETSKVPNRTLDYDITLKSWWFHDVAGNQWAQWEPVNPGEPFIFQCPAKAKGGITKVFVPGVFTDVGANYSGENGLGAFWVSPWEPFFYFIFRHRIKAPFIKKRVREFFFDGSGEVIPFIYRNFNAARETQPCVVNNKEMSKPELPVKLTEPETGVWAGGEGGWAEAGDNWGGQPLANRARAYALGTGNEWSFGFGNNSGEPFEITLVMLAAQFRKS